MACKTTAEKCVQEDELAPVLESLKGADAVVLAMPIYCSDVPGQVKCFIDRTYSYMKPNYRTERNASRVPAGKKLVLMVTQGAPAEELFAEVPRKYVDFLSRSMAFGESQILRAVGVGGGGTTGVPDRYLEEAEKFARQVVTG